MNRKRAAVLLTLACAGVLVLAQKGEASRERQAERSTRKKVIDQIGLDVAAIHRATDVINAQIDRGEIRDWETLQERVLDEIAFQKIAIREDFTA